MSQATRSVEERLTATLKAVAEQTPIHEDWDRLAADLRGPIRPLNNSDGRPAHRSHWFLLAAAAVLIVVAGGAVLLFDDQPSNVTATDSALDLVLPGEEVVATEPLTVQAAPGPEPDFDTGALGTELTFEPLAADDPTVPGLIEGTQFGGEDRSITKVTLVGQVNGEPWILVVDDAPNVMEVAGASSDDNLRTRSFFGTHGGSGSGDIVPIDSLDMIALPDVDSPEAQNGAGYDAPTGWVTWGPVPEVVSVVAFADSNTEMWIRPRAGMAVFPAQFDDGEQFTLQALDAEGNQVWSHTETVRYGDEPASPDLPSVGDTLGGIAGTDETGQPVELEPGAGPTALLFGAPWCVPCESDLNDAVDALRAFDPAIRIVAVPHYVDEGDTWPDRQDWAYERLVPERDSPLNEVMVLPTVIVLDETNTVVGTWRGFAETADQLEDLGP